MAKKKEEKTIEKEEKPAKSHKKLWLKLTLIFVAIFILIVVIISTNKYIDSEREKYYKDGGQKALGMVITEVEKTGGVTLKDGEKTLVLAKYHKEIVTNEEVIEENTEEVETNSNETATE